jgi:tyrosine-protein phosphatase SIW14
MSENKNDVTVSRRSTRLFVDEQQLTEAETTVQLGYESRCSCGDEKEREKLQRELREAVTSSSSIEVLRMPVVDLGKELCPIFPTTSEDIGKQGRFFTYNHG